MYQLGTVNGVKVNVAMDGFGEFRSIAGGGYPTRIWTDYMQAALKGKEVLSFPDPVYGGEITHRAPVAKPTQAPEPTDQPNPTPTQSEQPVPTATFPTQEPEPTRPDPRPTRSRGPKPTFSPPVEPNQDRP
jgi:membrane peptidoglycan carboxypeptidase